MNLALTMSECQQNKKLVSQIRLIVDNLNLYNFGVNVDRPDGLDGEVITADNGIDWVEITIIYSSGHVEMYHKSV